MSQPEKKRVHRGFDMRGRLAILTLVLSVPATGEDFLKPPVISARDYVSGSSKILVTGSFQINEDVAIDKQASKSDGQVTRLQFGVPGRTRPMLKCRSVLTKWESQ